MVFSGLKTVFATSYTGPSEQERQQLFVDPYFTETGTIIYRLHVHFKGYPSHIAKDVSLMETVPNMYKSVNQGYGNGPVHVLS